MDADGVVVAVRGPVLEATLTGAGGEPSLTDEVVRALAAALDRAEAAPACRVLVLRGGRGAFCAGLDLTEAAEENPDGRDARRSAAEFIALLRRFTRSPVMVVAAVDGPATGGGVGLAAASDLVLATERARFALPEVLWGLLPCCVLPFLIRRSGFQAAFSMTTTAHTLSAAAAERVGLVDELCTNLDAAVRRLCDRVGRTAPAALGEAKRYFEMLHPIDPGVERFAVDELARLMAAPEFRRSVSGYAAHGRFPWQREDPVAETLVARDGR